METAAAKCWSFLGRQGGEQKVSLNRNGCLYTNTVQHEVLHALGFHHEQVRSDRDQHVNILYENIQEGQHTYTHLYHKVLVLPSPTHPTGMVVWPQVE
ncbi:hypothetical protein INR49_020117, partial [Caranx melampygus]